MIRGNVKEGEDNHHPINRSERAEMKRDLQDQQYFRVAPISLLKKS